MSNQQLFRAVENALLDWEVYDNDASCMAEAVCKAIDEHTNKRTGATTPKAFESLVDEFLEHEQKLLNWKAKEYSDNVDRLMNFRQISGLIDTSMSSVALLYLLKHIQSITLAVRRGQYAWEWQTDEGEGLKQRIADARNYLLLLAACLEEDTCKKKELL